MKFSTMILIGLCITFSQLSRGEYVGIPYSVRCAGRIGAHTLNIQFSAVNDKITKAVISPRGHKLPDLYAPQRANFEVRDFKIFKAELLAQGLADIYFAGGGGVEGALTVNLKNNTGRWTEHKYTSFPKPKTTKWIAPLLCKIAQ